MELDIINRLYLELSQVASATTAKELELQRENKRLRDALLSIAAMPKYDQDDEHRLRQRATLALQNQ